MLFLKAYLFNINVSLGTIRRFILLCRFPYNIKDYNIMDYANWDVLFKLGWFKFSPSQLILDSYFDNNDLGYKSGRWVTLMPL